jgi:rubredoxin
MKTDTVYCPVCELKGFARVMTYQYGYSCGDKWTCPYCGNEHITDNTEERNNDVCS